MERLNLKPTHKPVQNYYEALRQFKTIGVSHEGAVRSAFQTLLEHCGRQFGWKLVPEWSIRKSGGHPIRVDGALVDEYRLTHGFWEAKDTADDLAKEVKKKIAAGYPQNNIIFQAPDRAILMQNGRVVLDQDISEADAIVQFLKRFLEYVPPEFEEWTDAVEHFQDRVPELGEALRALIEKEEKSNSRFRAAFETLFELCRQSINPNVSKEAVEEMLIQHLLTERIFRTVFNNPDFTRRNVIAAEIEKVIDALTSQSFSRDGFLHNELHCNEVMLLPYYIASMNIEHEFYDLVGTYELFEGICLVDTFELAEGSQATLSFMTPENTARVERQKASPIRVIIGNPPYNAKQLNENDANKNRRYKAMERLITESYAKDSKATLVNTLSDPYVKAIRWASDRIEDEGIVAFVTNNSFVNEIAFDGMRKHLAESFDEIYILNLGSNVRKNPKLSGSTHNVFGIQIGVSINLFVRKRTGEQSRQATIDYAATD